MTELLIYVLIFGLTFAGVKIFRQWSWRCRLLDVPNERSSHTVPTPRGGGLIIVLVCLTADAAATLLRAENFHWSYLLGASSIALISWLDDLYTISFAWRLLIQSGAAVLIVLTLGSFDEFYIPLPGSYNLGSAGILPTLLWIVGLTNAYNFMDGIDGIAGTQAVTAGIGWVLVGSILGVPSSGFYGGVLAAASFGFLLHNWQPAKVFMGDVGSAFLGFSFAVLPLLAKNEGGAAAGDQKFLLPAAVILVWLFAFDPLWTLGRRILNGEKVWEAHRGHLYQKLVGGGYSHRFVSGLYALISMFNVILLIFSLGSRNRELIFPSFLFPLLLLLFLILQTVGLLVVLQSIRRGKSK